MKIQIKSCWGSLLFEGDFSSLAVALAAAVKAKTYLRGADLRDADLRGAVLRGADLRDAYLSDADLRGAVLRGAYLRGAVLRGVPKIENLDAKILEAVGKPSCSLKMSTWHSCETSHCRAGWAIHLAGKAGYALEERVGSKNAGTLIYLKSTGRVPNFFASDKAAMEDIKKCAAEAK